MFFFNDTAGSEIYTLYLHDAHPISQSARWLQMAPDGSRWLQMAPDDSRYLQMAPEQAIEYPVIYGTFAKQAIESPVIYGTFAKQVSEFMHFYTALLGWVSYLMHFYTVNIASQSARWLQMAPDGSR